MILRRLLLQNFRSYAHADFTFADGVTFIIGPNTAGKSNLMEAIHLLSYGKSFRAEKDEQLVKFEEQVAWVKGEVMQTESNERVILEVALAEGSVTGRQHLVKKYQVNTLPKRRTDFAGTLKALLFEPSDLDIISGSPSLRREFLDEVLEQTDRDYRHAMLTYTKALRHRNALLQHVRETGVRNEKQFAYWDELLIGTGQAISQKRERLIDWMNVREKAIFTGHLVYDHSRISEERLLQYRDAELGSGVTLVGPHRDDVQLFMDSEVKEHIAVRSYGSRGQQRLAVVQLKLLQLQYMQEQLSEQPVLLLDDIFSELDEGHMRHLLSVVGNQQTIITTTHKEFLEEAKAVNPHMIELKK